MEIIFKVGDTVRMYYNTEPQTEIISPESPGGFITNGIIVPPFLADNREYVEVYSLKHKSCYCPFLGKLNRYTKVIHIPMLLMEKNCDENYDYFEE